MHVDREPTSHPPGQVFGAAAGVVVLWTVPEIVQGVRVNATAFGQNHGRGLISCCDLLRDGATWSLDEPIEVLPHEVPGFRLKLSKLFLKNFPRSSNFYRTGRCNKFYQCLY